MRRPCVDYRKLNSLTIRYCYRLPVIADLLHRVSKGKKLTQLDLHYGFLKNVPSTFQRVMESVLKDAIGICCEVYIDDIIIYSESEEEHASHVDRVFKLIRDAGLSMKIEKCHFGVKEMSILGFRLTVKGKELFPDR